MKTLVLLTALVGLVGCGLFCPEECKPVSEAEVTSGPRGSLKIHASLKYYDDEGREREMQVWAPFLMHTSKGRCFEGVAYVHLMLPPDYYRLEPQDITNEDELKEIRWETDLPGPFFVPDIVDDPYYQERLEVDIKDGSKSVRNFYYRQ